VPLQQAHQLDIDADLLKRLPDRRRGRRLDGTSEGAPPVVMAGMTDQQQQLMPDNGPKPGYVRSDTRPRNPTDSATPATATPLEIPRSVTGRPCTARKIQVN
jgi:hypothetical protein